ncbi:OLC1v1007267C1 [Oldenlandia corymbosa var. corymbosa]|uniref:OLC1v1007267C1 n=1 Tax=Oldenlandia corymbosa var. corymbosa TaxID=529605 RepID=A0AAV1DJH0_OLDCO|nr:OLC1v1007267C1 [Oldenlandia corymbosa var. corymbosa]
MLRNRSRVMTGKQASLPSPTQQSQISSNPVPSFLASPRIFNGLLARTLSEPDSAVMSPTSILDTKPFSNFVNLPIGHDQNVFSSPKKKNLSSSSSPEKNHTFEEVDGVKLGLALVNSLSNERDDTPLSNKLSNNKKMILFGSKLKVQIPPVQSGSTLSPASDPPKSPADFGIKTRNSVLLCTPQSGFGSPMKARNSPRELADGLSLREMELSEDYTCVITHGPNPKTTHIFDDCVVENCCGVVRLSELGKQSGDTFSSADQLNGSSLPMNFLDACNSCNNSLGDGKDVFMYRGEKALCSNECRSQEMIVEEGNEGF